MNRIEKVKSLLFPSTSKNSHENIFSGASKNSETKPATKSETYNGAPIKLVIIGAGQRAKCLLVYLLRFAKIHQIVVCDEKSAAVNDLVSYLRAALFVANPDDDKKDSVSGIVLNGPDDYSSALKIPVDTETGLPIQLNKWCMIASRNCNHKYDCLAAMSAGYHIFCEKPLSINLPGCTEILETYFSNQNQKSVISSNPYDCIPRLFVTGFVLRHAQMYQQVHSLIASGFTGKIISCEFNELLPPEHGSYIFRNWRRNLSESGPNILEKCSHDIDIILWLLSSEPSLVGGPNKILLPTRVAAFGGTNIFVKENQEAISRIRAEVAERDGKQASNYLFKHWASFDGIDDPFSSNGDIEDNLTAIIEFNNEARVSFHLNSFTALPQRRLLICGIEGTIEANLITGEIQNKRVSGHTRGNEKSSFKTTMETHGGGDVHLVKDWWAQIVSTGTVANSTEIPNQEIGNAAIPDSDLKVDEKQDEFSTGKPVEKSGASIRDMYVSAVTALAIEQARSERRIVDLETEYWQILKKEGFNF
ncbi:hypothetical protein HK096_001935 [Nowakowskiella sp. JEL0078]|nr:hypothetical protein HK096_001935 [Nowakowskiella sp. JEL0078]